MKKPPAELLSARFIPLYILLLVALIIISGLFTPDRLDKRSHPMIGTILPPFSLSTFGQGGSHFGPTLWKDQVAVVNVFASWCEPCKAEHDVFMKLAAAGVRPYGIAWKDTEANLSTYLQSRGNPYAAIGVDLQGSTALMLGLMGVPETYVVDQKNIVRWRHAGPLTFDIVNEELLPLLRELHGDE